MRRLLHVGSWLYLLQAVRTLVPVLLLPFVTRALGAEQFGVFSAALNVVVYFQVFVDYGFNLTGVRAIAVAADKAETAHVYSHVVAAKIGLLLISFIILAGSLVVLRLPAEHVSVVCVMFLMVASSALQQVWVFQGLQRTGWILGSGVSGSVVSVVLILAFIRTPEDLVLYAAFYSSGWLVSGIVSIVVVRSVLGIRLVPVNLAGVLQSLREGADVFVTSVLATVISAFGLSSLTIMRAPAVEIGGYAAVQKLALLLVAAYAPLGQVMFPESSRAFELGVREGLASVSRAAAWVMPLFIGVAIILVALSTPLIVVLFGESFGFGSQFAAPLLAWATLSIGSNLLGVQVLVAAGQSRVYAKAFVLAAIATVLLSLGLVHALGAVGAAWASVLSEGFLLSLLFWRVNRLRRFSHC